MERMKERELCRLLEGGQVLTAKDLAAALSVSEKTVRNAIPGINEGLAGGGAQIVSRPGAGFHLDITDPEAYTAKKEADNIQTGRLPETQKERVAFLMAYLMFRKDYVKMEELCDFLYVSQTTLSHDLKLMEGILSSYHLAIERRPNYGLRITGEEFHIRHLLCDYYVRRRSLNIEPPNVHLDHNLEKIAALVRELMIHYRVSLSELYFENFVDYTYAATERMKADFYIERSPEGLPEIAENEKAFVEDLLQQLCEKNGIPVRQEEKDYLLLYLAGKRAAGAMGENDSNFVIKGQVDELTVKILGQLQQDFHIPLLKNFDLRMALNQHLEPFDIRIRYGIPLENPVLSTIRSQYPLAMQLAMEASGILKEHYGKEISIDETGYLAMVLELGVAAAELPRDKSNVLLVCNTGMSTSRLLHYKFKERFSDYIEHIYVCDRVGLFTFDFSTVDYIFTTTPITVSVPVPIVEVGEFLESEDVERVLSVFKSGIYGNMVDRYYGPARFIGHLYAGSKDEALKLLCERIMKTEDVDSDFYDQVLAREAFVQMDVGNSIALPHPNRIASRDSFAYVAVLDRPIPWNNQTVQVLILVSIGRDDRDEARRKAFYEATAQFALNKAAVDALIAEPAYEKFVELIS